MATARNAITDDARHKGEFEREGHATTIGGGKVFFADEGKGEDYSDEALTDCRGDAGADNAEFGDRATTPDEEGIKEDVGEITEDICRHHEAGEAATREEPRERGAKGREEVGNREGEVVTAFGGNNVGRVACKVKEPVPEGNGEQEQGNTRDGEPNALAHRSGTGGTRTRACVLRHEGARVVDDVLQEGEHHKGHQPCGEGGLDAHNAITGEEDAVDEHHQRVACHGQDEGPSNGEAFTIGGRAHRGVPLG